ncbi:LOW QUALITY PROTEIN: uncharacterized protein LOC117639789 [Thrips palmi]|uniref:LOW QUALITY PROTEIN: uncharacterized protein LOC117639789 n=1 Tax=Thrips palmi TaxID=161013 RepID=A0A6P8Y6G4_THRPL|nr:LOW QUALITY PROTEIN: uncharacterized protein LOC117639789 [Thrips palmi]
MESSQSQGGQGDEAMQTVVSNGNGIANGKSGGVGNGTGNGVGNGIGNGVGNGTGNGIGNGVANGVGNGIGNGVGNGTGNGIGNGTGNGVGNGIEKKIGNGLSHRLTRRDRPAAKDESTKALEELRLTTIRGNIEGVRNALRKGVSVNQTLQGGWSPLMYACSMGHPDLVDVLLGEGGNPNFHKELFTPLMAACASSRENEEKLLRCVDLLLAYNVDVNAVERHRISALMFAAKEGHEKLVRRLSHRQGCNLNLQDSQGWTALFWAVNQGRTQVVATLVQAGAKVHIKDRRGQTAFDLAVSKGLSEIASILSTQHLSREPPDSSLDPLLDPSVNYADPALSASLASLPTGFWPTVRRTAAPRRMAAAETKKRIPNTPFSTCIYDCVGKLDTADASNQFCIPLPQVPDTNSIFSDTSFGLFSLLKVASLARVCATDTLSVCSPRHGRHGGCEAELAILLNGMALPQHADLSPPLFLTSPSPSPMCSRSPSRSRSRSRSPFGGDVVGNGCFDVSENGIHLSLNARNMIRAVRRRRERHLAGKDKKRTIAPITHCPRNETYSLQDALVVLASTVRHLSVLFASVSYVRLRLQGRPVDLPLDQRHSGTNGLAALSARALRQADLLCSEVRFLHQFTNKLNETDAIVPADVIVEKKDCMPSYTVSSILVVTAVSVVLVYKWRHGPPALVWWWW